MFEKVIVLHEYGDKRHFIALEKLKNEKEINEIQYLEFNLIRQLGKGILKLDKSSIKKFLKNIKNIPKLFISRNKVIILGIAPYDLRLLFFYSLRKRHKIIYFTSWPYWDYSFYPKKIFVNLQKKVWDKFLNGLTIASVTMKANDTLKNYRVNFNYIPHSIDLQTYKMDVRLKKHEVVSILFVGRLEYHKGIELIIKLVINNKWNNVNFVFVGDGLYRKKIEELSIKYSNVKYYGYIKDEKEKTRIYSEADIFILPSIKTHDWEELFGIVLIEAMAMGLPVISTDCVGPKEIISDGIDGFIIEQNNYYNLKEKLDLLVNNKTLLEEMSKNAIIKANAYDISEIKKKWKRLIYYTISN